MTPRIDPANHLGLVIHVVMRTPLGPLEYDDAIGIGNLALCEVAARYDPSKGSFGTYAYPRIVGAIKDAQRKVYGRYARPSVTSLDALMDSPNENWDYPDDSIHWTEWGDAIGTLEQLDDRERRIAVMRAKGMMNAQIAAVEGVSERRIGQLLGRMRERLAA